MAQIELVLIHLAEPLARWIADPGEPERGIDAGRAGEDREPVRDRRRQRVVKMEEHGVVEPIAARDSRSRSARDVPRCALRLSARSTPSQGRGCRSPSRLNRNRAPFLWTSTDPLYSSIVKYTPSSRSVAKADSTPVVVHPSLDVRECDLLRLEQSQIRTLRILEDRSPYEREEALRSRLLILARIASRASSSASSGSTRPRKNRASPVTSLTCFFTRTPLT